MCVSAFQYCGCLFCGLNCCLPPPPYRIQDRTSIDKVIRLVLTEKGPVYVNKDAVGTTILVRRVGNMLYTCGFANLLLREMTMSKGRLQEALNRIQLHVCLAGCELSNLFPTNGKVMWRLAQDVFELSPVRNLMRCFMDQMHAHAEFETITVDATVKICMAIMGQASGAEIRKDPTLRFDSLSLSLSLLMSHDPCRNP